MSYPAATPATLVAIAAELPRALVAFDFDGTLAPIVSRPEDVSVQPGSVEGMVVLAGLVGQVAVVTGRPAGDAVRLGALDRVPGLIVLGHYGLERWQAGEVDAPSPHPGVGSARRAVESLVSSAPTGVALEDKKYSVAVHTRRSADPAGTLEALRPAVEEIAEETGLEITPGKYVLELRAPGIDKGTAIRTLVQQSGARAVVFAGDDLGDLPAVAALRDLGLPSLVVCSDSPEAPPALRDAADLVVDGPAGLVSFLHQLIEILRTPPGTPAV